MLSKSSALFSVAILVLCWTTATATHAQEAKVRLAGVFGDHMVLQRDQPIPVWGWAAPGEKVTTSLADQKASATADENGALGVGDDLW